MGTDWLFAGDWLYKRFDRHPEIWRVSGQNETKAIVWASFLPLVTCVAFALTCAWLHLLSFNASSLLALAIWVIATVPLMVVNSLFMKVSVPITVSHAVGWLVKLLIAAAAVTLIVR
jgi:hypothetical protein